MPRIDARRLVTAVGIPIASLAVATGGVAILERDLGIPDASVVYLPAVVITAILAGTAGAVVSAGVAILLYDFLFTQPFHTLAIDDPDEWISLALLLFVAIVVGELAALQRSRTQLATDRERQARALFQVSHALATRTSTPAVLPEIARILREEAAVEGISIALGADDAQERVVAESATPSASLKLPIPGAHWVLQRAPGDAPSRWSRVHQAGPARRPRSGLDTLRIRVQANEMTLGSIWAVRARASTEPDRTATRLLSAAADQLGQVLAHDRLEADAQAAEIARQSDALKSALLQSVSHDFRTPLATIRAAAGTLRPERLSSDDRRASAEAIDREVEYLDRMVTNLLDLSRIEAGALRADRDVFELDDLAGRTLERLGPRLAERPVSVELTRHPVLVDPVFLDEALTNLVENALRHTAPKTAIRISASDVALDGHIRLTVEDAGAGVPSEALPHLFEKFYRVGARARGSRTGTGIGLAVVRGLSEAMGGSVGARRSEMGGLAVDLDLPAATLPAELEVTAET
jgi:two-component system sensor histidine kinase KdpD